MRYARPITSFIAACGVLATPIVTYAGETLDRIIATNEIRLGYRVDTPPFAYFKDGRPQGYSVELCSLLMGAVFSVADIEGITGQFVAVGAEERFDKLRAGEVDVLCGATTATLSRRETMSFTIPIFSTGAAAVIGDNAPEAVRKLFSDNGPRRFGDQKRATTVQGAKIGVHSGTTTETWIKSTFAGADEAYTLTRYADHAFGLAAVRNGVVDVYVADRAILTEQLNRAGNPSGVALTSRTFTNEPYALAVPRGDEDMRLMMDKALSYLFRTGRILNIYEKYFGAPTADVERFFLTVELPE